MRPDPCEDGKGALRVHGANAGYYSVGSVSVGFQAGAQSKAVIILFMTHDALEKFRNSSGWTAGADASVAIMKVGANGATALAVPFVAIVWIVICVLLIGVELHHLAFFAMFGAAGAAEEAGTCRRADRAIASRSRREEKARQAHEENR